MKRKDLVLIGGIGLLLAAGLAGTFDLGKLAEMTFMSAMIVLVYRMLGEFDD